jgi:thioredoxin-related protein
VIRRRTLLAGAAALAAGPARAATLGDDGMWHEAWFTESFLDLRDDLATATAAGKRLVVMWELRGCPYCRETHQVNFADPAIADYVQSNFDVVQLDVIGARPVTFPDGTRLPEKAQAARQRIEGTPGFQFFAGAGERVAPGVEVARFGGYVKPVPFVAFFRFVRERGYERGSLQDWMMRQQ